MRKILIFLLCFCTLFLCFVIPSFADEGVTSRAIPSDLTGVTVTVPSGWSATSGYGSFELYGTVANSSFIQLGIGINPFAGNMSNYVGFVTDSGGMEYYTNDSSFTFTVSSGATTNSSLIQWLVDNDAEFSGGEPQPVMYTVQQGFYNLAELPSPGVPSVGGFVTGIEHLYEVPTELHYSSGVVKSYNYFGFVLTSFEDSNNFSLDFSVQLLDIGTPVRIANLTAVDGVCSSQFYGGISRIYLGEDIVTDESSYQLISFMFTRDTSYLPDEPDVPEFTTNPWGYILEMIIDALKVPLFGYFSVWDIFVTICGIFILTWLLKLLAGG